MEKIKYLVMDVDGTLTDGKIYMGQRGEVFKVFDVKDGCGINDLLLAYHITPVIITGRKSEIVINRCKEIGVTKIYQDISDKLKKLTEIISDLDEVAYIGDDITDLSCMKAVQEAGGVVGCPVDAIASVIQVANFVSSHEGGNGAVRDFIEWIISGMKNQGEIL